MKQCVHFLSSLFFCPLLLNAEGQNKLIDSLEQRLPQLKGKEIRTALADLSWEYNSIDVSKSETYEEPSAIAKPMAMKVKKHACNICRAFWTKPAKTCARYRIR
jgi:hypothetical protein